MYVYAYFCGVKFLALGGDVKIAWEFLAKNLTGPELKAFFSPVYPAGGIFLVFTFYVEVLPSLY